jgi:RNA polymerase sigma-70 factor (ECF subfamily)
VDDRANEIRWERLTFLLGPIHAQAVTTARRLCRSAPDGDDLYQEAVLLAFRHLEKLRDERSFRSWFYSILISRHRSRTRTPFWKRFASLEARMESGHEAIGERGDEWAERTIGAARMARALGALPDVQREAIVLFEMQGFSIEEVASLQRASVPAVKSRLARGRETLRSYYERRGWAPRAAEAPTAHPFAADVPISNFGLAARESTHDR